MKSQQPGFVSHIPCQDLEGINPSPNIKRDTSHLAIRSHTPTINIVSHHSETGFDQTRRRLPNHSLLCITFIHPKTNLSEDMQAQADAALHDLQQAQMAQHVRSFFRCRENIPESIRMQQAQCFWLHKAQGLPFTSPPTSAGLVWTEPHNNHAWIFPLTLRDQKERLIENLWFREIQRDAKEETNGQVAVNFPSPQR